MLEESIKELEQEEEERKREENSTSNESIDVSIVLIDDVFLCSRTKGGGLLMSCFSLLFSSAGHKK